MFLYYALLAGLVMLFINLLRIQLFKFAKLDLLEQRAKLDLVESLVYLVFVIMLAGVLDTVGGLSNVWTATSDQETAALRTSIDEAYKLLRGNGIAMDITMAKTILQSLNNLMVQIRTNAINQYDQIINRYAGFDFGLLGISVRSVQQLLELSSGELDNVAKALVTLAYVIKATVSLNVMFSAALEAVSYVERMAPLFFMVGILLRAFHWTSGIGAAFISFSFAFYILFPFTLGIFLTGISINVGTSEDVVSLMVDESATYQYNEALAQLQTINFNRITEIETFVNVLYSKAMMGMVVATGLSLGMAMYLYSFLSKGSIVWGAPAGLLRLL